MAQSKVVQTNLEPHVYEFVLRTAEGRGLTLKEAARRALWEWAMREGDLSWDPWFNPKWALKAGKKTDSSKVDEVVYGRRKR